MVFYSGISWMLQSTIQWRRKNFMIFLNLKNKSPDRLGGCWVQCCQVGLFYQTLVWNQTQVKSLAIIDSSFALKVFLFTFSYMDTVKYRLNYLFKTERFMFLNFCPNCLKANFRLSLIFTKNNVFLCAFVGFSPFCVISKLTALYFTRNIN